MLTDVDAEFIEAMGTFKLRDILTPHELGGFVMYLEQQVDEPQLVIRFLVEKRDNGVDMPMYLWAIYNKDEDGEIVDCEVVMPQNGFAYIEVPPLVDTKKIFALERPIYLRTNFMMEGYDLVQSHIEEGEDNG